MPTPRQIDPTLTRLLRSRYEGEMTRRFLRLRRAIEALLVDEDALGLKQANRPLAGLVGNTRWAFQTSSQKLALFTAWLQQQIDNEILEVTLAEDGTPWTVAFSQEAYVKGHGKAFKDVNPEALSDPTFYKGRLAQFTLDALNSPVAVDKIKLLGARTYQDLKGVNESMAAQIRDRLVDGMIAGESPHTVAAKIVDRLKIGLNRAKTIARTEIIRAHAEGSLDAFEKMGIEEIGVEVEWSTAEDGRVCPLCRPLEGVILTVEKARGMFPRHPNCRCSPIPAFRDEKEPGQIRTRKRVLAAIKKSLRAEGKKKTLKQIIKTSPWSGADKL